MSRISASGWSDSEGGHQVLDPALEQVVAQVHHERRVAEERLGGEDRVRESQRRVLRDVRDAHAEPRTVAGRVADLVARLGRDDDPDIGDPGLRHGLDPVEQHRLIRDRNELLGARVGDRAQASALTARQDQSLDAACIAAQRTAWTCSARRDGGRPVPQRRRGVADGGASIGRLEHDRVARLLEHVAHELAHAGEPALDHDRAVLELPGDPALLAGPARPVRRDPDAGALRSRNLAGPRPAVDVGGGVDVGTRLERSSVTVADLIRSSRKWRTSSREGSKVATYQPSRPLISA